MAAPDTEPERANLRAKSTDTPAESSTPVAKGKPLRRAAHAERPATSTEAVRGAGARLTYLENW